MMANDNSPAIPATGYPGEGGKPFTFIFGRYSVIPQPSAQPLGAGEPPPNAIPPTFVQYGPSEGWEILSQGNVNFPAFIDGALVDVGETQVLPAGLGLQLIVDPEGSTTTDRYMRTGLILFDPNGRIDVRPYGVRAGSPLGIVLGLPTGSDIRMNFNPQPMSALGVALYDQSLFVGQAFTDGDANGNFNLPHLATGGDEPTEEQWIDENASVSLLNRAAGTLIGGGP